MLRYAFTAALILNLPASSFAQLAPGIAAGNGGAPLSPGIAAGWRMPAPQFGPVGPTKYHNGGNSGGGFVPAIPTRPGFPFSGIWAGGYGFGGGGYYPGYGYGSGGISYAPGYSFDFGNPGADALPATVLPPTGNIALVNEFPATLTLEFPAAAEVWVNGVKGEGRATTEWTLTSPVLKAGKEFTFKVKARWTLNGKTYEYERSVDVASGNRTRAQVIAGVEVKE
ncbi:MAG: TIGR03000 domain-containing protein [Planctomycetes bacterium]|nr:TIGR03000 domain-containing protein [Planctomycetota bacterium]